MTTAITGDMLLRAFDKHGVKYRFYKTKADWLSHNRNHAGANTSATEDGFGPIYGVVAHTTAMKKSERSQLGYLYTGDGPTSGKPGPLSLAAIVEDGTLVLLGWGAATHCGPGDPKTMRLAKADAMPRDREVTPTTDGDDPGTVPVNPFFLGFESCGYYVEELQRWVWWNATQRRAFVRASAAILELLGGPAKGYSGGSVVMHREWTTNRSDPQGEPNTGILRRDIDFELRAMVAASQPVQAQQVVCICSIAPSRITQFDPVTVTSTVTPAVPGTHIFEWSYPGKSEWRTFHTAETADGKATARSTPGSEIVYRVRFAPKDGKRFKVDWSPNVAVEVVTLAEHDAALASINKLRARVAELEGL